MSNGASEGRSLFCIPRRYFVTTLAVCVFLHGLIGLFYLVFFKALPGDEGIAAQRLENHCVGRSCREILSCEGTRTASFHTREIITLLCNMFFGYRGVLGSSYGYTQDTLWFATYLFALPWLLGGVFIADGGYTSVCGAYPLNVIDETLLWSVPNFPIQEALKTELRDAMSHHPVGYVNKLVKRNVFFDYFLVETAVVILIMYGARQVYSHAQYVHHGPLGLGHLYDIGEWRERQVLRLGRESVAKGYCGTARGETTGTP